MAALQDPGHEQHEEIQGGEPLEISLFIGGREFQLDGIALSGGTSFSDALRAQRDRLDDTIKNGLEEEALWEARLYDTEPDVEGIRLLLVEQAAYLDRIIGEFR